MQQRVKDVVNIYFFMTFFLYSFECKVLSVHQLLAAAHPLQLSWSSCCCSCSRLTVHRTARAVSVTLPPYMCNHSVCVCVLLHDTHTSMLKMCLLRSMIYLILYNLYTSICMFYNMHLSIYL